MPLLHLQKSRCGTGIEGADGSEVYGNLAGSGVQPLTCDFWFETLDWSQVKEKVDSRN